MDRGERRRGPHIPLLERLAVVCPPNSKNCQRCQDILTRNLAFPLRKRSWKAPVPLGYQSPQQSVHTLWSCRAGDSDVTMLWAAATLCFFGVFRAGEITVPSMKAFDAPTHLSWGDVSVGDVATSLTIRVHLKRSKMDQFGKGAKIQIWRTDCILCPVVAVLSYIQ